jgi:hypothetical protein
MKTGRFKAKRNSPWVLVLLISLTASQASPTAASQASDKREKKIGFSFKLSGGPGFWLGRGGDLDKYRKGIQSILADEYQGGGWATTFDWKQPSFLPDFGADIIFNIGRHLGFGIGTGFIPGSSVGNYTTSYQNNYSLWGVSYVSKGDDAYTENFKLSAIPLKFELYCFIPMRATSKWTIFVHAGAGYYFGKLMYELGYDSKDLRENKHGAYTYYKSQSTSNYVQNVQSTHRSWGYQGGLGLEIKMSRAISFAVELDGRLVKFNNWEGDAATHDVRTYKSGYGETAKSWAYETSTSKNTQESGLFWSFEIHNSDANKDYSCLQFLKEKPKYVFYQNVRKTEFSLNGLNLLVSIKFHFDLF